MPQRPDHAPRSDLQALAGPRHDVYQFLADAFLHPPTPELARQVCRPGFIRDVAALFDQETVESLARIADEAPSIEELQPQLRREFMNLFKVPGRRYVTPYESVFCDERRVDGQTYEGLLMGPSALDVKRYYRMAAMEISDDFEDLPDHVGLELHFLARLCDKEQEFIGAGDEARLNRTWEIQRDFLAAHLTRWLAKLRDKIHEKAWHAYYRAVADMAVDFTRRDLATLESVLGGSTAVPLKRLDEAEQP